MKTLEQKANAHADKIFHEIIDKYQSAPWNELRDALAQIYLAGATEALAGQWRSVEYELPEMLTRVLVCIKEPNGFPHIHVGKRIYHDTANPKDDKWHWTLVTRDSDVIAWMPLPAPPKPDSHV